MWRPSMNRMSTHRHVRHEHGVEGHVRGRNQIAIVFSAG